MAANRFVLCVALLWPFCGCMRDRDTIRQAALTYNAVEIFGRTPALLLARAAADGDVAEVNRLLASGIDPNTIGEHGITPLWWAAWAESLPGFVALLEHGANPNFLRKDDESLMILVVRLRNPSFLEQALKHGGDPNFRNDLPEETPIFEAIRPSAATRHRELLLAAGADLNAQDGNGYTPMISAISARGDYHLVWDFLQRGADFRFKSRGGMSLARAIGICHIDPASDAYQWREKVIEFLRSKGVEAHRPPNE